MPDSVVALLNTILDLEYTIVVYYPRLSRMVSDREVRDMVNKLGVASVRHADVVARAITRFKGKPVWALEPFALDDGLSAIFQRQLEKEETARRLHLHIAALMRDDRSRTEFESISREEESHIAIVKDILKRLSEKERSVKPPAPQFF